MNNGSIRLPIAAQIRVDDVAWFTGSDDRWCGLPSRSGLPRKHCPEDYLPLEKIGAALGIKFACALVLGEWDIHNRLRGVPHVTWDEENWDMASKIDREIAERSAQMLETSDHIEYMIHGLLHGYYDHGKQVTEEQYYPRTKNPETGEYTKQWTHLPLDEFRRHLDLFYEICHDWGFTKKIASFACPNGCNGAPEENTEYADILRREYGITTWMNSWRHFKDNIEVISGVVCEKGRACVPWNAYDIEPLRLPNVYSEDMERPYADFAFHWPNFLRYHAESNLERVDDWVKFFLREAETFGIMLSRDTAFGASQCVYSRFSSVDITDGKCVIDVSGAEAKNAADLRNEFYVSMKNGTEPKACEGGTFELFETKQNFKTYKVTRRNTDRITLTL